MFSFPISFFDLPKNAQKWLRIWLFTGVVLVFVQVLIGGITRLTDSGLSITEWEVIKGSIPPLNETDWNIAFEKYKTHAAKQYQTLHADMTISEFKRIYFWEYFHRLWARSMGFVFLFPFLFFVFKKWVTPSILKQLGWVIFLAILAATFGWIMVASGLNNDTRTWVSAYKLVIHLSIATALFSVLIYTFFSTIKIEKINALSIEKKHIRNIVLITFIQILFGGLMAGMRAGLIHPHFPVFIHGSYFFEVLFQNFNNESLVNYEPAISLKALVQVIHRGTAWLLSAYVLFYFWKVKNNTNRALQNAANILVLTVVFQFLLGVFTIVSCVGHVPVLLGVAHQGGALVLLSIALWNYIVSTKN